MAQLDKYSSLNNAAPLPVPKVHTCRYPPRPPEQTFPVMFRSSLFANKDEQVASKRNAPLPLLILLQSSPSIERRELQWFQ